MAGKLLPYVAIGLIQTTLILVLGWFLFGVPVAGRLVDLYVGALLFIAASLSLGLLISTIAQTQFQAMQMAIVTLLPSILHVGVHVPVRGHAESRAMDRPGAAAHAFQRDHPRRSCSGARRSPTCVRRS